MENYPVVRLALIISAVFWGLVILSWIVTGIQEYIAVRRSMRRWRSR